MTPERWTRIEELFHRAAECAQKDRAGVLEGACTDDPELRREVEALLSSEGKAGDSVRAAVRGGLDDVGFPLTGETVSHYSILDGVGGGGMGLVYRAEDIRLGRRVALKFLPEESVQDPGALGRFEREARSASALEHPNICPIYEFGEHKGQPFLVMQLLEGQTLRDIISGDGHQEAPLEFTKLLDVSVQIAHGLEAAHRHGIIHRDIKPANIFVTTGGQTKILDFGLAKVSHDEVLHEESAQTEVRETALEISQYSTLEPLLSRAGMAMGTTGYMSPEQVRGEKLDSRTDLFSFGLLLYEMATGRRAFTGETAPIVCSAILNDIPIPVRKLNPKIPVKLQTIISKALEKNREARYRTASEMSDALLSLKLDARPASAFSRLWLAVAASAAMAAAVAFWFAARHSSPLEPPPEVKQRQVTANTSDNAARSGSISPDGESLAYADRSGIHIKRLGTGETIDIPQPMGPDTVDWYPGSWFPDGTRFLANARPLGIEPVDETSKDTSVWVVPMSGDPPHKLRDNAIAYSISPDGASVSFGAAAGKYGDREMWLMRPDGDQAHKLFDVGEDSGIKSLIWSPDGQRAMYLKTDKTGIAFASRDVKGGPLTTIPVPPDANGVFDPLWLSDGRLLYSQGEEGINWGTCNLWEMRVNSRTGELVEKPRRVTSWVGSCLLGLSATTDAKRVAFGKWMFHITAEVAGLKDGGTRLVAPRRFTLSESNDYPTDWTADSRSLLILSNRDGHLGIYKQDLDRGAAVPLVYGPNDLAFSHVSPDGAWALFEVPTNPKDASSKMQGMRVPITGGSPQFISTLAPFAQVLCARSPADNCVLMEPTEDRKQAVYSVYDPLKGRGPELMRVDSTSERFGWDLSPDGRNIVVRKRVQGPLQVLSLNGQLLREISAKELSNMKSLDYAADSKGFYIANVAEGEVILYHVDLNGRTHKVWGQRSGFSTFARPSPDGRHLAFQALTSESNIWTIEKF